MTSLGAVAGSMSGVWAGWLTAGGRQKAQERAGRDRRHGAGWPRAGRGRRRGRPGTGRAGWSWTWGSGAAWGGRWKTSPMPPRRAIYTRVEEKRDGEWLIVASQATNIVPRASAVVTDASHQNPGQ